MVNQLLDMLATNSPMANMPSASMKSDQTPDALAASSRSFQQMVEQGNKSKGMLRDEIRLAATQVEQAAKKGSQPADNPDPAAILGALPVPGLYLDPQMQPYDLSEDPEGRRIVEELLKAPEEMPIFPLAQQSALRRLTGEKEEEDSAGSNNLEADPQFSSESHLPTGTYYPDSEWIDEEAQPQLNVPMGGPEEALPEVEVPHVALPEAFDVEASVADPNVHEQAATVYAPQAVPQEVQQILDAVASDSSLSSPVVSAEQAATVHESLLAGRSAASEYNPGDVHAAKDYNIYKEPAALHTEQRVAAIPLDIEGQPVGQDGDLPWLKQGPIDLSAPQTNVGQNSSKQEDLPWLTQSDDAATGELRTEMFPATLPEDGEEYKPVVKVSRTSGEEVVIAAPVETVVAATTYPVTQTRSEGSARINTPVTPISSRPQKTDSQPEGLAPLRQLPDMEHLDHDPVAPASKQAPGFSALPEDHPGLLPQHTGHELPMAATHGAPDALAGTQSAGSELQARLDHLSTRTIQLSHGVPATPGEQVVVQIRQHLANGGGDRIHVHLEPAELGRVDVRLDIGHDGRTQVLVSADHRDTLDLLQRDARQLEKALQQAGLDMDEGSLEFNLSSRQQGGEQKDQYASLPADPYGKGVGQEDIKQDYVDPVTGHYTITVNDRLDIRV